MEGIRSMRRASSALRAVASAQVDFLKSYHASAARSKVLSITRLSAAVATLIARRSAVGSIPPANCLRALAAAILAVATVSLGYTPRASNFSLPPKRNFSRQYLLPSGFTSRNRPSPSNSLRGLLSGLAFITALSVRRVAILGMGSILWTGSVGYLAQVPPNVPPKIAGCNSNPWDGLKLKTALNDCMPWLLWVLMGLGETC